MGYFKELQKRCWQQDKKFAARAVRMAQNDGLPEPGSDEIRVHRPLVDDEYISTAKPMVSFRRPNGQAIALLERLSADDEHTHITGRDAIAVDPKTGHVFDRCLFFQNYRGDYTSVISWAEIQIDFFRKKKNQEIRNKDKGHFGHVMMFFNEEDHRLRGLASQFQAAASVMGIKLDPNLENNRRLFRVNPMSFVTKEPKLGV